MSIPSFGIDIRKLGIHIRNLETLIRNLRTEICFAGGGYFQYPSKSVSLYYDETTAP